MDQQRIKEAARRLKEVILKHSTTDGNMLFLLDRFLPIITDAVDGKFIEPTKIWGNKTIFDSGLYDQYQDLQDAYSTLSAELLDPNRFK
ncbi:hypothetical protein [Solimicrobium silvestre]|uniref:Uncharacterized protein n=1 Tax=Solimicrobium silvestre TaxID=2099400 RepID=A0A2S9GXN6_9BURK|nr:hypothetical protein [Solimicrobium silvestre]PRC92485.1 hypothetical protein S2091_2860 [Solimicrobium silvestre]